MLVYSSTQPGFLVQVQRLHRIGLQEGEIIWNKVRR